ncbi:MAG: hypothetical protein AB7T49_03515 [Oligoflexales bacterium]
MTRLALRVIRAYSLLFLFHSVSSQAAEARWTMYGLRPLAMGNAFVAVADDFNALFYNPAGLARLKEWDGELLNPTLAVSKNTTSFVKDAQSLSSGGKDSTEQTLALFEEQTGKSQYFSVGLTPHLIFPHFGLAIGAEVVGSLVFHRYPSVDFEAGPRVILPIAYAHNFLENRLSIGVGVKYRLRGGVNHEFSIQDMEAFSNNKDEEGDSEGPQIDDYVEGGTGYGADVGMLFTPTDDMEPTLGVSITDIGGTPYKKFNVQGKALGVPEAVPPSLNIGMSIKPIKMERMYVLTSLDVHSVNLPYSFSKKFNLGTEIGLGSILKVQAGLHQGYLSGGLQLDVGLLNLRAVSYSEELGTVAGQVEDRRYAVQLKLLI